MDGVDNHRYAATELETAAGFDTGVSVGEFCC